MHDQGDEVRDVVCGMWVNPSSHTLEFKGMHLAFCSEECRERFRENPGLFIGRPGEPAAKASGEVWRKSRRIHLGKHLEAGQAEQIVNQLNSLMSISASWPGEDVVEVDYDLLQITSRQIEQALESAGAQLGGSWPDRLKRSFVHLLEETESSSRAVEPMGGSGGHHHH